MAYTGMGSEVREACAKWRRQARRMELVTDGGTLAWGVALLLSRARSGECAGGGAGSAGNGREDGHGGREGWRVEINNRVLVLKGIVGDRFSRHVRSRRKRYRALRADEAITELK